MRGPKHSRRQGKTPVLQADEARTLIDAIDTDSLPGLRDRALIGLMVNTSSRVGAAVSMKVEDYFVQGHRGWVRLPRPQAFFPASARTRGLSRRSNLCGP